eukprot:1158176-Pelagomonas_calceolata.AAC.8
MRADELRQKKAGAQPKRCAAWRNAEAKCLVRALPEMLLAAPECSVGVVYRQSAVISVLVYQRLDSSELPAWSECTEVWKRSLLIACFVGKHVVHVGPQGRPQQPASHHQLPYKCRP